MSRRNKHIGIIALFVLPALFFYGTFNVVGIVRTFFYSFMDWKGISANRTFIGLGNYIELFGDSFFWNAMKNNVILVIVSVAIQLPGALLLALLINQELKGTRFFRTVFFMPMLLSTVATGIMWILFYDPYFRPDGQSHAEAWDEEHRIFGGKFLYAFHYVRHMLAVHPLLHDYIKGRADQYFSRYL